MATWFPAQVWAALVGMMQGERNWISNSRDRAVLYGQLGLGKNACDKNRLRRSPSGNSSFHPLPTLAT